MWMTSQPHCVRLKWERRVCDCRSVQGSIIPIMQQVLDNPFLLLFAGVVIPTVFYIIWGILEIAQIPIAD